MFVYTIARLFPFFCSGPLGFLMNALKLTKFTSHWYLQRERRREKPKNAFTSTKTSYKTPQSYQQLVSNEIARFIFTLNKMGNEKVAKKNNIMSNMIQNSINVVALWEKCVFLCVCIHATANNSRISKNKTAIVNTQCSLIHFFCSFKNFDSRCVFYSYTNFSCGSHVFFPDSQFFINAILQFVVSSKK